MKENKTKNIMIMGLIGIVLSFFIVSVALMIKPVNVGIVIDRVTNNDGTKSLIYGTHNLKLFKGFIITALVLSSINLVNYLLIFYFKKIKEENNIFKFLLIVEIVILVLLVSFSIFVLSVYPNKYDKYNNFSWALGLVNLILAISLFPYTILSLMPHKEDKTKQIWSVQMVTEGAIMVALSMVLSVLSDLIPFLKLPNGGSFSLSMLPIFIFALRRGSIGGFVVGLAYSIINFLIDGMVLHWGSIFFDYLIPYSLLGFISGLFMKKASLGKVSFTVLGVLLGGFVRYLFHSLSGVIFFASYAPSEVSAFFYSFVLYNLPYMAVSTAGALIFVLILHKTLITEDSRVV